MEQPNELEKQDKKKINEDMVMFMRKRSAHDAPRYTARLKTYVDIQRKRRRAAAARRNSEHSCTTDNKTSSPTAAVRKKSDEQKDKEKEAALGQMETAEPGNQPNMFGGKNMRSRRLDGSSAKLCSIISNSSESVMLASGKQQHHHHHHHDHGHHHHHHHDDCECARGWFGRRGGVEEKPARARSASRSHSDDLSERCGRQVAGRMRKARTRIHRPMRQRREKNPKQQEDAFIAFSRWFSGKSHRQPSCCGRRRRRRSCRRRRRRCCRRRKRRCRRRRKRCKCRRRRRRRC